jgi:hypothetical protein
MEGRPLFAADHRKRLHQSRQPQSRRFASIQDRLDDIRRQQGEQQDATEIAAIDLLRPRQLVDRRVSALLQQPLPALRAGQRFHERKLLVSSRINRQLAG